MGKLVPLLLTAALVAAPLAAAGTITLGRGLGPWRLGQKYREGTRLIRSERFPANDGPGCDLGPRTASRVDYYPGLRLSWRGGPERRNLYLIDVATSRTGDRSGNGFVIGQSRLGDVRRAHSKASLDHPRNRFTLGRSALTIIRKTGDETWVSFTYWFDAGGVLAALETQASGC
jgi:hypothetical protein